MNESFSSNGETVPRTRDIVQAANAQHVTIDQFRDILRQRAIAAGDAAGQRIVPEDLKRPYVVMILHDLLRQYTPQVWGHVQEWLSAHPEKLGVYLQSPGTRLELYPAPEPILDELRSASLPSLEAHIDRLKACTYSICHHRCQTWERQKNVGPQDNDFAILSSLCAQFSADRSVSGTVSEGFKTSIKFMWNTGTTGLAAFVREFGEEALTEERIMRLIDNGYTELVVPLASSGKAPFMEFEKHAQGCLIRPGDRDRIFTPYLASAFRMSGTPDNPVMSPCAEVMPAPKINGVHVRHGCVAMGKVIEENFQWMRELYETYVVKNGAWKKFLPEISALAQQ